MIINTLLVYRKLSYMIKDIFNCDMKTVCRQIQLKVGDRPITFEIENRDF